MEKRSDQDIVVKFLQRFELAETERLKMAGIFKTLGDYARPSRDSVMTPVGPQINTKNTYRHTRLFDDTLIQVNQQHAAGFKSWMSPAEVPWFRMDAPYQFANDDEVESWYDQVTEITQVIMATSNFNTEEHEAILDGGAFGTRGLYVEKGKRAPLNFRCWEIGTFSIMENSEGYIDTTFKTQEYDPRQAAQEFGEAALPDSVRTTLKDRPGEITKDVYIHGLYPREDAERDSYKIDPPNMPVASIWVHQKSKTIVRKSGFEEMPAICSRYLKWGNSPYGLPPTMLCLSSARQLNGLQKDLDILASIAANPRLLVPDGMEGNIDLRPGGVTLFRDQANIPRTWGTENRYDIGQDRVKMRQMSINDAFNMDVFKAFQRRIDKVMTATEVVAIQREALDLFSPTFALSTVEHYTPLLQRVFSILLRGGYYPPVPQKLLVPQGNGMGFIPPPAVAYTSRLAMAMRQVHSQAFKESMQQRIELANVLGPAAFDDINIAKGLKMVDRGNGLPENLFRTDEEIAQLQQARAQQAQQQQQMEQAQGMSGVAKNLKGTPMAQQMADKMQQGAHAA